VAHIFGFTEEDYIGKVSFPPVQAVPSFPGSFPHLFHVQDKLRYLIPYAIDQFKIDDVRKNDSAAEELKKSL
nr:tryptophan--tRNA ligase, cytoplasmic [Tanacetum cinerariifolium]